MSELDGRIPAELEPPRLPRTARNVFSNWAGFLVGAAVSFFLSPFVVHRLGDTAYGIWVLIGSLTGYMGLLDLGVRGAVTRYVARFHAQANHEESSRVVSSALAIFLLTGAAAILLAAALAFLVVDRFQIPEELRTTARLILILAGLNIAVSLTSGVFGGTVVGLQRFDLSNAVEVGTAVLRAAVVVAALSLGKGLLALAVIHLSFSVASGLLYAWLSRRLYPGLRMSLGQCDWQHLRLIFSFSAFSFILHISSSLVYHTDSLVIGAFLPVSMVTFFAIAGNLMNYSRALVSGISTTMAPLASALEAEGKAKEIEAIFLKATRYATLLILPIVVTFMLRGTEFITLWMGPKYGELSGHVLWVLSLALVFAAANQVATSVMLGIGRHRPLVPVFLAEALCNLGLSVLLVRPMGVLGVAWGTAIPSLCVSLLFWPWYVRHSLQIPSRRYLLSTWGWPAVSMVPFGLATQVVHRFWPVQNLAFFLVQVAFLLPLAGLGVWHFALKPLERETLSGKLVAIFRPGHGTLRR